MKLSGEEVEKGELRKKLYGVSKFMDDMVKKHETDRFQLSEDFNVYWNKYQAKKIELKTANKCTELLNVELNDLIKTNENLDCRLEELNGKYECLEKENRELNNGSIYCKQKIINLKSDNEIQTECLNKSSEELIRTKNKLFQTNDEWDEVKEDNRKLRNKMEFLRDELFDAVERAKLSELMLVKDIDVLKSEHHIEETRNAELNRTLCGEKIGRRELKVAIKKSNEKRDALKETLENRRTETDRCADELRKEKSNVENERKRLENETEERAVELRTVECRNEKLIARIGDMERELETVVGNGEETGKSSSEKLERIVGDTKRLKAEIASKDRTVLELHDRLFKQERARKTEIENVHCLRREIEILKQNQNVPPVPAPLVSYAPCSCPDHDYRDTDYVNEILDETTKTSFCCTYDDFGASPDREESSGARTGEMISESDSVF